MKVLSSTQFISERMKIKPVTNSDMGELQKKYGKCKYFPQTKFELKNIIEERIEKEGYECDLNDIDISKITDMSRLFTSSEARCKFNGDISKWDVSHVANMEGMFLRSDFNGDISMWNVSNVDSMSYMFFGSKFDGDLSGWKVKNDVMHANMFDSSPLYSKPQKQPHFN